MRPLPLCFLVIRLLRASMALLSSSSMSTADIRSDFPVKQAVRGWGTLLRPRLTSVGKVAVRRLPRNMLATEGRRYRVYCLKLSEATQGMKPKLRNHWHMCNVSTCNLLRYVHCPQESLLCCHSTTPDGRCIDDVACMLTRACTCRYHWQAFRVSPPVSLQQAQ